ncbi:hypothetical protein [Bradyrhizobium cenepequi]
MDDVTRAEIDKLHGRVSDLKERVVNLEAQQPHINASLVRIERSVEKLNGHLVKAIFGILALLGAAIAKFIVSGGLHVP